jgi:hypothetical protein
MNHLLIVRIGSCKIYGTAKLALSWKVIVRKPDLARRLATPMQLCSPPPRVAQGCTVTTVTSDKPSVPLDCGSHVCTFKSPEGVSTLWLLQLDGIMTKLEWTEI